MQNDECRIDRPTTRCARWRRRLAAPLAGATSVRKRSRARSTRMLCLERRGRQSELEGRDRRGATNDGHRHQAGRRTLRRPRAAGPATASSPRRPGGAGWASRMTSRPAISATGVRDVGAAWPTTRSAQSAVVTATTARTCRVARIRIGGVGPHVDAASRRRQARQVNSLYVGCPPGVSPAIPHGSSTGRRGGVVRPRVW